MTIKSCKTCDKITNESENTAKIICGKCKTQIQIDYRKTPKGKKSVQKGRETSTLVRHLIWEKKQNQTPMLHYCSKCHHEMFEVGRIKQWIFFWCETCDLNEKFLEPKYFNCLRLIDEKLNKLIKNKIVYFLK